jgi:hypothetical protein
MIDIQDVLRDVPHFETYCSVDRLRELVDELRADPRFEVTEPGASANGVPIHLVRFGEGSVKALVVGGPHVHEPIGSLTVFALLTLLRAGHPQLVAADVEWHVVPCIDPDGSILNEGWTQGPFDLDRFIRNFYLQARPDQVDFSFPVSYKELRFDRPSHEARILMAILDDLRPDYFFSLHNSSFAGGAWFAVTRDIGQETYAGIRELLEHEGVPLQEASVSGAELHAPGVIPLPTLREHYDFLEQKGLPIPDEYREGRAGAGSQEYLIEIKPDALVFIAELTYGTHPAEVSDRETGEHLRQLKLRIAADNKFLAAVVLDEWERTKGDLDTGSPFYRKIAFDLVETKDKLHEGVTAWYERPIQSLLFDPDDARPATERDRIEAYRFKGYFLGNAYNFVRLLRESTPTPAVLGAIERLESIFSDAIDAMKTHIDFDAYEPIELDRLARAQLGSGLIALNSVLADHERTAS